LPYIRLYALTHDEQYNMRFLPRAGGLFDQDWLLIEVFGIIRDEFVKVENSKCQSSRKPTLR